VGVHTQAQERRCGGDYLHRGSRSEPRARSDLTHCRALDMTVTACEGHRAGNAIVAHWEIPPATRVVRGNTEILARIMDAVPQLIWSTTPNGLLEYGNSAWKSAVTADCGVPVESALLPRLHDADQEAWRQQWLAALRTGQAYEFEYRLETLAHDSRRWLLERGTPVRDA